MTFSSRMSLGASCDSITTEGNALKVEKKSARATVGPISDDGPIGDSGLMKLVKGVCLICFCIVVLFMIYILVSEASEARVHVSEPASGE